MKKLILLSISFAFLSVLSSCSAGYVETEPSYIEVARPASPSSSHIWINGDWQWRNNAYRHQEGHWEQPRNGRTYTQGHWDRSSRGNHWNNGRWH